MLTEKYPSSIFKECKITKFEELRENFCYLVNVTFKNIKCKYQNNFISYSKCNEISGGRYDNGRVISADELTMTLTDVDLKFIFKTYKFENYTFNEVYFATKDYLPIEFLNFILEKYENKTKFKDVKR